MITLDAATDSLEVKLGGVVSTSQLPFTTSYADLNTSTFAVTTFAENDGTTNNTTAVTLVAAPAASRARKISLVNIYNADTAAATVTVQYNANSTLRVLCKITLAVDSTLQYTDGGGWKVISSSGQLQSGGGAPDNVDYVVGTASSSLSAERVITNSTTNTWDTAVAGQVQVQRAALTGDIEASANSNTTAITAGVIVNADVNASAAIAASKLVGARTGSSTYSTLQHFINFATSAGRVSGGAISASATANAVDVTAGTGFIKATDSDVAELTFFDWGASTALSVPSNTTRYIGVEYNAGTPQVVARTSENWDYDTDFPLGICVNEGGTRYIIGNPWITSDTIGNIIERFDSSAFIERDNRTGGLTLSNTGTRNVAVSAGALLSRMSEFTFAALNTATAGSFDVYYRNGAGGWTKVAAQTQWNNDSWDDGDGTLGALTALSYTSRWFYAMTDGSVAMLYGQSQDLDFSDILDESPPSSTPDRISKLGILIGRFIIRAAGTTPALTQSAFGTSFTSASVSNHNDLASIQGGTAGEYYHATSAEYTGTGTGNFVRTSSPTITTPTISGAIVFPDDVRQTFNPGTNAAGLNVGALAGDPLTLSNGDLWYDSTANELTARINGASISLAGGGPTISGTPANNQIAVWTSATAIEGISGFTFDNTTLAIPGQITFPATQSASSNANTLDDYEEGSWTPVLGGSGGTSGQTYSADTGGRYIKIGQLVVAGFFLQLDTEGTITTNAEIQGLPFTSTAGPGNQQMFATPARWSGLATNWVDIIYSVNNSATVATVFGAAAAGTENQTNLTATDIANGTNMRGTIIYRASA